jgi:hypothetical protein
MEMLADKGSIALTAEEHEILLQYLALYRKLDEKEHIHIYFHRNMDAVGYLK